MVRNCCIAWFLFSFINALCSMVLTSTEQFPLSLLFAVQSKVHLFVLTYHCQVLCCLDYRWILGCRASSRTTMTPSESCRAWGESGADAAEFHQESLKAAVEPQHPSTARVPGCVCNPTHRNSQRSHGISFAPKIKRFLGCSEEYSQEYFFKNVINSLTKCIYKLLPNIHHISDIKDSRIEFSNT